MKLVITDYIQNKILQMNLLEETDTKAPQINIEFLHL